MNKFKLKELIRVFVFLLVIQFIIGVADILLSQANSELSSITAVLITICSFPMSLIDGDLPFFVSENLFIRGVYWLINLAMQSVFLYLILVVVNKLRETK